MWQLELLSWVIPAFGALAKELIESGPRPDLCRSAQDCYSDLVNIGLALSTSQGEWASGLEDEQIDRLLKALESQIPKRKSIFSMLNEVTDIEHVNSKKFPCLDKLAESIQSEDLGGYDECFELQGQPSALRHQYLSIIGHNVPLFHKEEKKCKAKRDKFLEKIRRATEHLLDVYFRAPCGVGAEEFDLSSHPSYGMKEIANRTYGLLERHWKCHCVQRVRPPGLREARLNLFAHRRSEPKVAQEGFTAHNHTLAKFEILLPVCKDNVEWKVTNVEVIKPRPETSISRDRQTVNNDICHLLSKSQHFQVDFLAQNDKLWHLKPRPSESANHHTQMESLQQLLGDGVSVSDFSKYTPKDKLILCYVLANSMLFLYPGSWFQTAWSSDKIYFVRRFGNSTSPALMFPYLSVAFQQAQNNPPNHMQYHSHPAILALGIIFLEIATNAKFTRRSQEPTPWEQFNSDGMQALQQLQKLERQITRDRSKRISRALIKVIRSCLILEPPSNFPCKGLSEEGPIRQYILSCIIRPLASDLNDGYKISLDKLHDGLMLEKGTEDLDQPGVKRMSSSTAAKVASAKITAINPIETRELCLFGGKVGREVRPEGDKKTAADAWFEWHIDALNRIEKLRKPDVIGSQRVRIAILDSGIELSQDQRDMYDVDPKIEYRSWVGGDTEWKDDVGHGTHLAVLLRKIAPNAAIHVARVFKKRPHIEKSAQNIAAAIRYAVDEWAVDVIVMSFGFAGRNETVYDAIKYAAFKDVLMFAAASNDGKNRPDGVAWPAIEPHVVCVHSGDGYGNQSSFTPSPKENMRIMVLGECVTSAWPPTLDLPGDNKDMSGTSCAAPIAAGVAAVILDYARGFLSQQEWKSFHRLDSMRRMFERLRDPDSHSGCWWIQHWALFDSKRDESWIQGEIKGFLV